ncbi:MAG: hypothetical protein Q4F25_05610 [Eubacteriales bacterium]|nr:hypothetical protein [Eubacteriales bacterium]
MKKRRYTAVGAALMAAALAMSGCSQNTVSQNSAEADTVDDASSGGTSVSTPSAGDTSSASGEIFVEEFDVESNMNADVYGPPPE